MMISILEENDFPDHMITDVVNEDQYHSDHQTENVVQTFSDDDDEIIGEDINSSDDDELFENQFPSPGNGNKEV